MPLPFLVCMYIYVGHRCCVLDLAGPSIYQCLQAAGPNGFPMRVNQMIMRHLLSHLLYIHTQRQLHRDINIHNVCLDLNSPIPPTDAESIDATGKWIYKGKGNAEMHTI